MPGAPFTWIKPPSARIGFDDFEHLAAEEALRLADGFKLLHLPLSSACRLVRVLRSVVQSLVLAMLDGWHDLPLRRAIVGKLVGDQHGLAINS